MNTRLLRCAALLLASAVPAFAQVPGALKNVTSAYELQRGALTSTFENQVKASRARYLGALEAAHKSALAAARTTDLAAISAEISAVNLGALPEAAPPDLPRSLGADRRAFLTAFNGANRMLVPRQRELAMNYLRSLAALEESARKSRDQPLLDALALEKQRALSEVENSGGGQKNRNIIENGDFSRASAAGWPEGWTKAQSWKDVPDAIVVTEGREKFLRFRRLEAIMQADLKPERLLPIPARARSAEVTFRMRAEGLVKGTKEYDVYPGVHLSAKDGRDESLAKEEAVMKENSGWRRMTARVALPDGTKSLRVSLGPFGAAGIIDFDDVAVEFK